ncbi:MAG: LysM peptidoglycan-binding domain-containing protein [Bacteroidota bacterium]
MKPIGLVLAFLAGSIIQLSAQCNNYSRPGVHVVQSGENLYRIAKRYDISTFDLAEWNNISVQTTLYACQELSVVAPEYTPIIATTIPADYYQERGATNNYTNSGPIFGKQSGNKHTIRAGETIAGLAELYGYTESRFREINLLKPGEELSVGSVILSTDCACNRIATYEDLNNGYNTTTTTSSYPSSYNSSTNNYSNQDTYQVRGGNDDYDPFYDNPQRATNGRTTTYPANSNSSNGRIISKTNPTNTPSSYNEPAKRTAPSSITVSVPYMSNEENQMLTEINLMRSNPAGYIPYIEQYKRDIQSGKSFGSSLAVCDELIAELRRTRKLSILQPAPCLYQAAKKHGLDQQSRGSTGHDGSDGSWPWDRVKRECSQMTDGNENLVGGPADVREAVILLLVDDGIPSRGHRKTLLNKDWVYGATYKIGQVGYMPNCWVQKFGY